MYSLTNESIKSANLTPEEEKVLRMRYGIALDADTPLEQSKDPALLRLEMRILEEMRRRRLWGPKMPK